MTTVKGGDMYVTRECDSDACPAPGGFMSSQPELAGNAFMLAAFAALIPLNVYTGIRYKTPLYASLITVGLVLEVLSHVGKILLHSDMAHPTYFSLHMVANLWGPTIIGAAIYTALPHLMAIYGPEVRIMSRPVYLNLFFAVLVIFTMAFQSVGMVFAIDGNTVAEVPYSNSPPRVTPSVQYLLTTFDRCPRQCTWPLLVSPSSWPVWLYSSPCIIMFVTGIPIGDISLTLSWLSSACL